MVNGGNSFSIRLVQAERHALRVHVVDHGRQSVREVVLLRVQREKRLGARPGRARFFTSHNAFWGIFFLTQGIDIGGGGHPTPWRKLTGTSTRYHPNC
eukprot:gene22853-biopygen16293